MKNSSLQVPHRKGGERDAPLRRGAMHRLPPWGVVGGGSVKGGGGNLLEEKSDDTTASQVTNVSVDSRRSS